MGKQAEKVEKESKIRGRGWRAFASSSPTPSDKFSNVDAHEGSCFYKPAALPVTKL